MRIIAFFVLILPFLPASSHAQTFGGLGSRAEGMGRAFVAVADDASAIYWNPAGLGWPAGSTFDAQLFAAPSVSPGAPPTVFFGAAMPVLGLGYYRVHTVSTADDRQNGGSGAVALRGLTTSNFGATIVQSIGSKVVVGTTVRLVSGAVDDVEGRTTMDLDAGAMVSAGALRVGMTARNLRGPRFQGGPEPVRLERQVRVGAAWVPRSRLTGIHGPFSLAFDVDLTTTPVSAEPDGNGREAAVGGEYWLLAGRIGGRAGVRWNAADWVDPVLSGGFSVQVPGLVAYPVLLEGHLTKASTSGEVTWGLGARLTF
jgi:F plasmid transfer operon, TraF, protein